MSYMRFASWISYPLFHDDGADAVDHDNGLLVDGSNCLDQLVSVVPRVQVSSVTSVALDSDVALATIAVDAHDSYISVLSCTSSLLRVVVW